MSYWMKLLPESEAPRRGLLVQMLYIVFTNKKNNKHHVFKMERKNPLLEFMQWADYYDSNDSIYRICIHWWMIFRKISSILNHCTFFSFLRDLVQCLFFGSMKKEVNGCSALSTVIFRSCSADFHLWLKAYSLESTIRESPFWNSTLVFRFRLWVLKIWSGLNQIVSICL